MNLYMLGSSPDSGRKRPYKIGDTADVETTQRMYPYILPHHAKLRGGAWASLTVSATYDPSASHRSPRMLLASRAEVLWRGVEAAGVADARIEPKEIGGEGCQSKEDGKAQERWNCRYPSLTTVSSTAGPF